MSSSLAVGESGSEVTCLQQRLNDAMTSGTPLVADGQFGPVTATALSALQAQLGLTVDGIAGRQTGEALGIWEEPSYQIQPVASSDCHPAYTSVCIPNVSRDLDCGDIPFRRFDVGPSDPFRFDNDDDDNIGCESD